MLVIGHSHPECAFNDSLIDGLCNCSNSGEAYFYTFLKTKKIIEQNPQIKTVFIEFSNNQITKHMNDRIWGDKGELPRFPQYASFLGKDDFLLLYKNNSKGVKKNLPIAFRNNVNRVITGLHSNIKGGYRYLIRDKTDSLLVAQEKEKKIAVDSANNDELSDTNIAYLTKLIELLKENHIKIYLIRSPLHKKYEGYENEQIFQSVLSAKFSDMEFLDFSKYPLLNSEFGDLGHLNYRGAKRFSLWFNRLIQDGLLEKENKQHFIEERELE
jgi:hypothetical protein